MNKNLRSELQEAPKKFQFLCWCYCLRTFGALNLLSQQSAGDLYTLGASALGDPSRWFFCGLPLCGSVAVFPEYFYFVIEPLKVDCGKSLREEISRTKLLQRWHPITVPSSIPLSSLEWPILSQMFVKVDCTVMGLILYCWNGKRLISKIKRCGPRVPVSSRF